MNKRIQQLAEKAGSTHKQNLGVFQFYSDELEKFAELIVRECAGLCSIAAPGRDAEDIEEAILKHFGVEE